MVRRSVWLLQRFIPRSLVPRWPNCPESVSTLSTQKTSSSGGVLIRSGWRGPVVGAVLADASRANGLDCTAMRSGRWQGTGIAGADEIDRIERPALVVMDSAVDLSASLRDHGGDVGIVT